MAKKEIRTTRLEPLTGKDNILLGRPPDSVAARAAALGIAPESCEFCARADLAPELINQ